MTKFSQDYHRQRQTPQRKDYLYIHFKDLVDAVKPRVQQARGVWLDYGSGSSPYRAYFRNAKLLLADMVTDSDEFSEETVDYILTPGQPCPGRDASFDGILSTQVLEHIADAAFYLRDAFRMLRPGGEMLLTTHGIWEDHPCPFDFWRWTAQGLRHEFEKAGFEVIECLPLTCGPRALLFLLAHQLSQTRLSCLSLTGLLLNGLRIIAKRKPELLHRYADRFLTNLQVGREDIDRFYIALLVSARKPG